MHRGSKNVYFRVMVIKSSPTSAFYRARGVAPILLVRPVGRSCGVRVLIMSTEEIARQAAEAVQSAVIDKIQTVFGARLDEMQEVIGKQQEKIAQLQVTKINDVKFTDNYKFDKPYNEEQFNVNTSIQEKVQEAKELMEVFDPASHANVVKISTALEEGLKIIKGRQKEILLADSSSAGWAVVKEY